MSRSELCASQTRSGFAQAVFAIRQLMQKTLRRPTGHKRKRLAPGDLSPHLIRDVGLTDAAWSSGSLEEKWRLEMKLQAK